MSIGRDETDDVRIDEPNASRHHARLHVGRGAGDRGPRQHQRHPAARQPAAARAAHRGAAGRGDLDRVGDVDDPAAPAHRARAPASDARYFEGRLEEECDKAATSGRVFAVCACTSRPGRRRGGQRDRVAARAAGRRAGVVRPRRIRDDPVRARRQAGGGFRRARSSARSATGASPRAPASRFSRPTRAPPTA